MTRLRPLFITALCLSTSWPAVVLAQVRYEAVTTTRVKVRCGPSEDYYTTAILERDTRVTVVREEANGWLAIEPPEGSFSWIAGAYVREISSTEGEVTGNDVQVRIGTPADPRKRDESQKKLKRGDRVRILEKSTAGEGPLTKISYKIVPPPGEVRYVSGQCVQPVSGRRPQQRPTTSSSGSTKPPPPRDLGTEDDSDSDTASQTGRYTPSATADGESDPQSTSTSPDTPRDPVERANAAYQEMIQRPLPERDIAAVRGLYEQAAQSAKTKAEHELIAARLELLQTQEERQAKFVEFDRALRRSKQRDEALLSIPRRRKGDEAAESGESQAETSPRYDASGTLRRSTAIIDGRPAYVLLSPQGGIRYYVTPSPGIDLNKYLDKVVAVRGPSSYRVEVRAQHITVRDITVIELRESGYRDAKPERGSRRS